MAIQYSRTICLRHLCYHLEVYNLALIYVLNLFLLTLHCYTLQFGDHDGVGSEVLLQHPLGVFCGSDGHIYLADSYNHKVIVYS